MVKQRPSNPSPDLDRLQTQYELQIGPTKFYDLIANGELEAYRLGGPKSPLQITRKSVDKFKERHRVDPKSFAAARQAFKGRERRDA